MGKIYTEAIIQGPTGSLNGTSPEIEMLKIELMTIKARMSMREREHIEEVAELEEEITSLRSKLAQIASKTGQAGVYHSY